MAVSAVSRKGLKALWDGGPEGRGGWWDGGPEGRGGWWTAGLKGAVALLLEGGRGQAEWRCRLRPPAPPRSWFWPRTLGL